MKNGTNKVKLRTPICFAYKLIACFIGLSVLHLSSQNPMSLEDLLEGIEYSKDVRPFYGEHPINIEIQVQVLKISDIDEQSLSFKITYILRQSWKDPRLARNDSQGDIIYQDEANALIWIPNLDIVYADKTESLKRTHLTILSANGDILATERMVSTNTCQMDLEQYPMDTQICPFRIEPFAYSAKEVNMTWAANPVILASRLKLSGFVLVDAVAKKNDDAYMMNGVPVEWSNLLVEFHFKRLVLHVFYRTYLPIFLVIIFNMGSYWIPDSALPARCTMIITTFLTSTFILQNVSERTEASEKTTALQIFIAFSITIIVVAICQYLLILYLRARKKMRILRKKSSFANNSINMLRIHKVQVLPCKEGTEYSEEEVKKMKIEMEDVHILDKIFRILIPIIYIIFCVIYFGYYMRNY